MVEPPDEYLVVHPQLYKHEWWQGKREHFHWLQSKHFTCSHFFNAVPAPASGCRILVSMRTDYPPYCQTMGWTDMGQDIASSPVLSHWDDLKVGEEGVGFLVVPSTAKVQQISPMFSGLTVFDKHYIHLGSTEDQEIKSFWTTLGSLEPLMYLVDGFVFTIISPDKDVIEQLIESHSFGSLEARRHEQARQRLQNLWHSIGPECGPETCVEPGCGRLRIALAIRCFVHQLSGGELPLDTTRL